MTIYPNVSAMVLAATMRTMLAASELKLYKAITTPLSVATVIGNLTECDFSGYAEKAIANFLLPYLDPEGGASIQTGTQQFQYVEPIEDPIGNTVLGFYLLNAAGALIVVGSFPSGVAMNANGDAIPLNVTLNYGRS